MILGLDLGINKTGWCVGDGPRAPTAGCWRFEPTGDDLGGFGSPFLAKLVHLQADHDFQVVIYEAPFLDRYRDKLVVLRKILGMGFLLETWCRMQGIEYDEKPFGQLKKALAGFAGAKKDDMVSVAKRCGVPLPPNANQGMEDAADAFAAWLIGVGAHARQHQPMWDKRLYSRAAGALL